MFLMWIIPLLLAALVVYVVSGNNLVNAFKLIPYDACSQCKRAVQNDWNNCPYCGQTL